MKKLFILGTAIALVAAFTLPAMAAEWSFYGSTRMQTFYEKDSKDVMNGLAAGIAPATQFEDSDTTWLQQGNSRIGARVKAGDIAGRFEYGTGVNLRLLYATWNFGPGKLLVGQDYPPMYTTVASMCGAPSYGGGDCGLLGYGANYTNRYDQLKLLFGSFQFAAIEPVNNAVIGAAPALTAATEYDTTIPKLEAKYSFGYGPMAFDVWGGYNSTDAVDRYAAGGVMTEKEMSIDAWVFGGRAKYGVGPIYLRGSLYFGQNTGNYGMNERFGRGATVTTINRAARDVTGRDVVDNDTVGFNLVGGFKLSDMVTFEIGYGSVNYERENAAIAGAVVGGVTIKEESESSAYYLQAKISPAKNVFIVPEIGKIDFNEYKVTGAADVDQGDVTYYGVKWHINF